MGLLYLICLSTTSFNAKFMPIIWDKYKQDIAREIHPEGLPKGKQYKKVGRYFDEELGAWVNTFELEDIPMSSSSGTKQGAKYAPRGKGISKKAKAFAGGSRWIDRLDQQIEKRRLQSKSKLPKRERVKKQAKKEGVTTGSQWRKYGTLTLKLAPSEIKKIKRTLGI